MKSTAKMGLSVLIILTFFVSHGFSSSAKSSGSCFGSGADPESSFVETRNFTVQLTVVASLDLCAVFPIVLSAGSPNQKLRRNATRQRLVSATQFVLVEHLF